MILLTAVRARLGAGAVRTGTVFDSFTSTADGVSVRTRVTIIRGRRDLHGRRARRRGRAALQRAGTAAPGRAAALWSGIMLWRGVTPGRQFLTGRSVTASGTNASLKFVAYPISRAAELRGEALINWVAEAMVPGTPPGWRRGLEPARAAGGRAALVLLMEVRVAGHPRADPRRRRDPRVPDGGPRPAALVGSRAGSRCSATRRIRCTRSARTAARRPSWTPGSSRTAWQRRGPPGRACGPTKTSAGKRSTRSCWPAVTCPRTGCCSWSARAP